MARGVGRPMICPPMDMGGEPAPLREAAQDDHPPVAGYDANGHRRIELD